MRCAGGCRVKPSNLDLFAYLAAFVSVILALAVSDWLQSFHRLLRARKRVRWSAIAILAACLVFLSILEEFFDLWRLVGVERFTYVDLLTLIFPPIVISIAAMTVLPDEVPPEGIDLAEHYMENRRLVFLLLALWICGVFVKVNDLHELITGKRASVAELAELFPWQTVPILLTFAVLAFSKNMWVQLVGVLASLVLVNSAMIDRSLEIAPAG